MKKLIVAIPHSHTWLWTGTCIASLVRNPPKLPNFSIEVIVIDNSPWSPAIRTINDLSIKPCLLEQLAKHVDAVSVMPNYKSNKFHASALDCVVETHDFDYLMALETDVLALKPTWLQWFMDQLKPSDYAVGHWHHEQFINPSCTLYRGDVLRSMVHWCRHSAPQDELRWGEGFSKTGPLDNNLPLSENPAAILKDMKSWISGPFAEKRGWPAGTILREQPSGQVKGPGWYEPGQQLHHFAVEEGFTYTVCPTLTTFREDHLPLQTLYGATMPDPQRQLEAVELFGNAETAHMWGGTRALDVLKHPVTCEFVKANTPMWLAREARFWKEVAYDENVLALIRKYGWHITGQGSDTISDRDREAAAYVESCYKQGGISW